MRREEDLCCGEAAGPLSHTLDAPSHFHLQQNLRFRRNGNRWSRIIERRGLAGGWEASVAHGTLGILARLFGRRHGDRGRIADVIRCVHLFSRPDDPATTPATNYGGFGKAERPQANTNADIRNRPLGTPRRPWRCAGRGCGRGCGRRGWCENEDRCQMPAERHIWRMQLRETDMGVGWIGKPARRAGHTHKRRTLRLAPWAMPRSLHSGTTESGDASPLSPPPIGRARNRDFTQQRHGWASQCSAASGCALVSLAASPH